jgi:hypothetical protein
MENREKIGWICIAIAIILIVIAVGQLGYARGHNKVVKATQYCGELYVWDSDNLEKEYLYGTGVLINYNNEELFDGCKYIMNRCTEMGCDKSFDENGLIVCHCDLAKL